MSNAVLKLGHQHQDRRHMPLANPIERRHTINQNFHNGNDRRHLNNLSDRRHISPPLHINICENANAMLNTAPNDGMHQRNLVDFSHSQRRHARGIWIVQLVQLANDCFVCFLQMFVLVLFIFSSIHHSSTDKLVMKVSKVKVRPVNVGVYLVLVIILNWMHSLLHLREDLQGNIHPPLPTTLCRYCNEYYLLSIESDFIYRLVHLNSFLKGE